MAEVLKLEIGMSILGPAGLDGMLVEAHPRVDAEVPKLLFHHKDRPNALCSEAFPLELHAVL
jgi:hypothetical protein